MDWIIVILLVLLVIDRIWFHKWYKKKFKRVKPRNIGELTVTLTADTSQFKEAISEAQKESERLLENYIVLQHIKAKNRYEKENS